ncbi:TadE/TadG family type IV pilus assembly protein [Sphingomonas sp. IC4-52]|uniref:TadE/TadG family type IV pilus assembly protein n=1 Tax=Sphingomonas sp. IC4-52 TaxID=2887202 RepID=UPI001D115B11|nr:TadE/TadG family type IV pilus assembly protein [Sphingomonas sp. IC4-52]MCC2978624.1 pilus assembly protein [Sphingomonas sp. IC4-52]
MRIVKTTMVMQGSKRVENNGAAHFLGRLRRDVRGNTLAMMAAFLIPLAAFTGSAVDVGRMYLVKIRLQQACDAGVLAGRKFMADSTSSTLDANAITQARAFFASNFPSGIMGTPAYTNTTNPYPFIPTKTADNQVAGTATTLVPMTIMTMFGAPTQPLTVTCEARFDIADTDIMFVLDTTGSMACLPTDTSCSQPAQSYQRPDNSGIAFGWVEKSGSAISGLRTAVLNFYDTMAANIDTRTKVRYGFVTYTSTVNVGSVLPAGSLVSQANYQSRQLNGESVINTVGPQYVQEGYNNCMARAGRSPSDGFSTNGLATRTYTNWASGYCTIYRQNLKPNWRYSQTQRDVRAFGRGEWVTDPTKVTGAMVKWQGCIEERSTNAGATSFDTDNLPPDLDPDLRPTTEDTRWVPLWPDVTYYRPGPYPVDYSGSGTNPYGDFALYSQSGGTNYTNVSPDAGTGWSRNLDSGFHTCGKPVQLLKEMSRADVSNYVNATDFRAIGGTYHDVGMIWGLRLISPTGLFASYTAAHPGRQSPNRYIVFMTDGEMAPDDRVYGMYGIERLDDRISGGSGDLKNYHNKRFVAVCSAAKERGITVFVVGFGQTLNNELTACASQGQAYYARDNAALTAAFQSIAKQVALLRISK